MNELIAGFAGAGRVDLVERFAFPLPATVIFTLIGFPSTDFGRIRDWCSGRLSMIWSRTNAGTHLAFGKGVHLCIGASLARQEVHVTFPTSTSFRGPDTLFVEWDNTYLNKTYIEGGNSHSGI